MMDKKQVNDVLRHNVGLLSKMTNQEVGMMPATEAPLPSADMVKQIVTLAKRIIFPDYFNKRQPDEAIRTKEQVYTEAERLALEFVATLPEIKRLLYTDVQAFLSSPYI